MVNISIQLIDCLHLAVSLIFSTHPNTKAIPVAATSIERLGPSWGGAPDKLYSKFILDVVGLLKGLPEVGNFFRASID